MLAIQLCSQHQCDFVHDPFSFDIVLSEREKHLGVVGRNGNGSGNNSRPRYGFLGFIGEFAAF